MNGRRERAARFGSQIAERDQRETIQGGASQGRKPAAKRTRPEAATSESAAPPARPRRATARSQRARARAGIPREKPARIPATRAGPSQIQPRAAPATMANQATWKMTKTANRRRVSRFIERPHQRPAPELRPGEEELGVADHPLAEPALAVAEVVAPEALEAFRITE